MDRFALLLELSRAFGARLELDELVRLVLERTTHALAAEACSILLLDPEAGELHFLATSDPSPAVAERLRSLRFPADRGVAGSVLRQGQARIVPDVAEAPEFYPAIDDQTGVRTRSLLCAPLRTQRGPIGVIELVNRREGVFSEDDAAFLDALSGSLAIALENARMYAVLQRSEAQLREEVAVLRRERNHRERFPEIVGGGAAMQRVFALMETAAASTITVLLQGETGVGKEVVARAIHRHGPRSGAPFVAVNCGALPEPLLESELFGYRRGAFTGAAEDRPGLFEAAGGGTLFLDEIGETTPATQVKLLRALQEGEIRRVGDTRVRKVDVRVLSATNRGLLGEAGEPQFRPDLYYRISVFPILVPPLRERREDIPMLVALFLERSSRRLAKSVTGIRSDALDRLVAHAWPGNVRELENEIERAVALAGPGAEITLACLSERIVAPRAASFAPAVGGPLREARAVFEREYVAAVLNQQQGNATQAARLLGISRQMLQRKIREYRLREA